MINRMQKKICIAVLAVLVSLPLFAQSASDIEMAKRLARQQGYSEKQIEAMLKQKNEASSSGFQSRTDNKSIDRNAAIREQQQYRRQNGDERKTLTGYGVSGRESMEISDVPVDSVNFAEKNNLVFGHDLFRNTNLNFVPNYNMPTPENYKLAPGDEVVIDVWGDVITTITAIISPEGSVNIPDLGPVYLAGQTVVKAEQSLKEYMGKIYSGILGPTPNTFVKLALGKIRSITINVVGDVRIPGSYVMPSLSTMASAMYLAGGPADIGTVREIKLYRKNKLISTLDVYDFITNGTFDTNLRLEDDDIISVGTYSGIVTAEGGVKRPMRYEIKAGETLDKILSYAGGFSDDAYGNMVHVERVYSRGDKPGATSQAFDVLKKDFSGFKLENGDIIIVKQNEKRFDNRVEIAGAVWRPGNYSIAHADGGSGVKTLRQLITAAGGLKEDAYMLKAYIQRFSSDRSKEQISFSLQSVILGKDDIMLYPDDYVRIFSQEELTPKQTVNIYGEINNPSGPDMEYEYRKGMTLGDIILNAGGITDAASLTKVEIARRITKGKDDISKNDTVALVLYYNLMTNPSDADTRLEPFDIIFVRKSASYKPQQTIYVNGEVNYPGAYVIEKNVVRISDVISKAQGVNQDAYIKGAKLTRVLTKEEFERLRTALEIARKQVSDSTVIDEINIGNRYDIAIDLEAALAAPGSYADAVLRENDIISIPKFNNTVKISGAVLYPNTISYNPRYSWKRYISNAGGTLQKAMNSKIYMVHMNGSVATRGSKDFRVRPGTEIVVPAKEKKPSGQSLAAILGIASSTASLAAMVVTIINQVK